MPGNKVLIGVFGLSDYELRLVRSVLSLTIASNRIHSYGLIDMAGGDTPDIAILDPDNVSAKAAFDALVARNSGPEPVVLLISKTEPAQTRTHFMLRPLAPTKMLALLDRIADGIAKVVSPASPSTSLSMPAPALTVAPASTMSDAKSPSAGHAYRALIVDDSPTVSIKINLELRPMNISADFAETGEQALHMLAQKSYDIIFLDIVLPGADGYEVCKVIRRNPDTKRIPVVMLTSKSSPFDRIRGSLAGCTNYLTKPVEISKFHSVVEKCLTASDSTHAPDKVHASAVAA